MESIIIGYDVISLKDGTPMPKQTASNFKSTVFACYRGYITQGIVNNLSPLFFVIYQTHFHISYELIAPLILCS